MLMQIIWWVVTGLVIGAIARFLLPGSDPMGCFGTILLGIAGSFAGGFIASLIWKTSGEGFQPAGFLMSLVGAVLLLWIFRKFRRSG
jgi:uncharacterized membrane protein YeaQ/YmgE (transglycosylase-associated protein family)